MRLRRCEVMAEVSLSTMELKMDVKACRKPRHNPEKLHKKLSQAKKHGCKHLKSQYYPLGSSGVQKSWESAGQRSESVSPGSGSLLGRVSQGFLGSPVHLGKEC